LFNGLEQQGRTAISEQGYHGNLIQVIRRLDLRYLGTEASLTIAEPDDGDWQRAFADAHHGRYGYTRPGVPIQVVQARLEVLGKTPQDGPVSMDHAKGSGALAEAAPRTTPVWFDGVCHEQVPVYLREELTSGQTLIGPALILEGTGSIVLAPGFSANMGEGGTLTLTDIEGAPRVTLASEADPVNLEIFNNLFMSIAEQMGTVLQNASVSTNIKERLDFSCALFDGEGGLVANAPHIPVHLGAMGESVRAVANAHPNPKPGDVFISNDPAMGGSHLPDVTVVTPVHLNGQVRFYTASRGHHADIGGITPGSMPPFSTALDQEGVVFSADYLVREGQLLEDEIRAKLAAPPYPAREPDANLADLAAQVAANRKGEQLIREMAEQYGLETVSAYMGHVQANARDQVAAAIANLPDGTHRFADRMDDGTPIAVALTVDGNRMAIDFAGTGPQVDGNLNAPTAVVMAAVIYVLRTLVAARIPLNAGCLLPVTVDYPKQSIIDPDPGRAVVAGNVETSQRVVDVLLAAAGQAAASQGTMNNLTFGDKSFGYYETIAGGAGAGPGFAGASGVHTHMTNTRITDPEVLESRYPVRLLRFALRLGSGGAGQFAGGDGLERVLQFLAPLDVSLLCERRLSPPFGLAGGQPGQPGASHLERVGGRLEKLDGKVAIRVAAGDILHIHTPGGGGYGPPAS
jgi:5-oxoprolinase (ATP-hydrolysing)